MNVKDSFLSYLSIAVKGIRYVVKRMIPYDGVTVNIFFSKAENAFFTAL